MFEELSAAIREEVVLILFHAQIEPQDAGVLQEMSAGPVDGNGSLSYEHESLAGAQAIAAAGGAATTASAPAGVMTPVGGGGGMVMTQQRVTSEHEKLGRNDPCWCGSGKKFKKCHGT